MNSKPSVVLAVLVNVFFLFSCEKEVIIPEEEELPGTGFTTFLVDGQTLPTAINSSHKVVKLEVGPEIDLSQISPEFTIPEGHSVYINGELQESGNTIIDLSTPVTYEIKSKSNSSTSWQVAAVNLGCKIVIDASHDGGVWWFPQHNGTGYNPDEWHQGKPFAGSLRAKGYEVIELGRDKELTEEMFFGNYIVIRAGGFESYSTKELEVYNKLMQRGMNLVFFTDHKNHDPIDELGDYLNIKYDGTIYGEIANFKEHQITANLNSIDYVAGSVVTNVNEQMEILGWVENQPVMGVMERANSRIFFIGDMNGIEDQPQPFINNLISWMGDCGGLY